MRCSLAVVTWVCLVELCAQNKVFVLGAPQISEADASVLTRIKRGYPAATSGSWSVWAPWDQCSLTCGRGFRQRRRTCSTEQCSGNWHETEICENLCPEEGFTCDFETNCSYIKDISTGSYHWFRGGPDTPTRNTGPRGDQSGVDYKGGKFMYTEASHGRENDRAVFKVSPDIKGTGTQYCLSFWYHMYGRHIGTLRVKYSHITERFNYTLLPLTGQQGAHYLHWNSFNVPIFGLKGRFTILFEATRGDGEEGDIAIDDLSFYKGLCKSGKWGRWGSWSPCSKTCGPGSRNRFRACDVEPCQFNAKPSYYQHELCIEQEECDGVLGPWSLWSTCSVTCDSGTKSRTRSCERGPCPVSDHPSRKEEKYCFERRCPDRWTTWGPWGPCDKTCGEGRTNRHRRCINPPGRPCLDSDTDTKLCENKHEGQWTEWSSWTCDVTCGLGTRSQTRECRSPCNDAVCPGTKYNRRTCIKGSCPR